jgi:hypothetical protein
MVLIKCPGCGKEIENDVDFCYYCGASIGSNEDEFSVANDNQVVIEKQMITEATNNEQEADYSVSTGLTVAELIKIISLVVLALSIIGSFIIWVKLGVAVGIACLIISVLNSLLAYGVGEIICVLHEISSKL